jgi:BlaI family transcriptional regulator, penicillinase repressor
MPAKPPLPTDSELEILRVLWDRGPSTVREVHDVLRRARDTGYTTVLKLLQIMHGKRIVERDERARTHVYRAAVAPEETQRHLVTDLARRAFEGSAARLAMHALGAGRASAKELQALRALLDELEAEGR